MKALRISLFLTFFTSCSYYLKLNNTDKVEYKKDYLNQASLQCYQDELNSFQKKRHDQYFSYSQNTLELYQSLIKKRETSPSFIEKVILWSLTQSLTRPDASSPNSRFFFILYYNGKSYLHDFSNQDKSSQSFKDGLAFINSLKYSKEKYKKIINWAQQHFPQKVMINNKLSAFLEKNEAYSLKDKMFSNLFYRNGERLIAGETYNRLPLQRFKTIHSTQRKSKVKLIKFSDEISCNFDLNHYQNSNYSIKSLASKTSNFFALQDTKGNAFLGWTGTEISLKNKMTQAMSPPSICYSKPNSSFLISFNSRDPGQILFHLRQELSTKKQNTREFKDIIEFSRYIYLENPERIIYESERGTEKQLNNLYASRLPLYHVDKIGEAWGFTINTSKKASLVHDSRSNIELLCQDEND